MGLWDGVWAGETVGAKRKENRTQKNCGDHDHFFSLKTHHIMLSSNPLGVADVVEALACCAIACQVEY